MPARKRKNAERQVDEAWSTDWHLDLQVCIGSRGEPMLGEELADLLAAIDKTNSISAGARQVGISYRHAWKLVHEGNEAAGEPLVLAATGGIHGGGAQLTPRGKAALEIFNRVSRGLRETAAGLLQAAIGNSEQAETTLHLSAAISLQEVVGQVLTEYALREPAVRVRCIFGASNELAAHILAGAPCDLFLPADAVHFEKLIAAKRIRANSARPIAINSLAVIGNAQAPKMTSPEQLGRAKRIAVADAACPLGRCTKEYLEQAGVYSSLADKLVTVDNSRGILSAIASGQAEIGVAFASDVGKASEGRVLFTIEPSEMMATYHAAVCAPSGSKAAQALLEFFQGKTAQQCFRRCGFMLPQVSRLPRAGR